MPAAKVSLRRNNTVKGLSVVILSSRFGALNEQVSFFTSPILRIQDLEGKSKHREFHCAPEALETIAKEIGDPFTAGRIFQSPFICNESICQRFLGFHTAMSSKPTAIEVSTRLREFVGEMIIRYGNRPAKTLRFGNERPAVRRVKDFLQSCYAENVSLEELARLANLSPFHLIRVFRKEVGLRPHAYQTRLRLGCAKALLAKGNTIGEAALSTGFFDQSHFTNHFRKVFGYPPGAHLKGIRSKSKYFQDSPSLACAAINRSQGPAQ